LDLPTKEEYEDMSLDDRVKCFREFAGTKEITLATYIPLISGTRESIPESLKNNYFKYNINEFKSEYEQIQKIPEFENFSTETQFRAALNRYEKVLEQILNNKKENAMTENQKYVENYVNLLLANKNLILTGAPGTGKTYLAKQIATQIIGEIGDGNEQIGFVQFHPSYDYTDFVEGLRPINDNSSNEIGFELKNGIFKSFCKDAKKFEFERSSGVDNFDETWDKMISAINESKPEYLMERSDVPVTLNSRANPKFKTPVATKEQVRELYKNKETNLKYETYHKIVLAHLKLKFGLQDYQAGKTSLTKNPKKFIFIIDEINRGEISKIFGELFFSIDPSYRGVDGKVKTQYANIQTEETKFDDSLENGYFYVPENVYIIGTMNDIDRSVESFDFAMRRRFTWEEITAKQSQRMFDNNEFDEWKTEAIERMDLLNNAIWNEEAKNEEKDKRIDGLNTSYHIGAAYFLKLKEYKGNYAELWKYHLEPLLKEYLRGMPDEKTKLGELKKAYDMQTPVDDSAKEK